MDLSNLNQLKDQLKKKPSVGRGQVLVRVKHQHVVIKVPSRVLVIPRNSSFEGGQMPLQRRVPMDSKTSIAEYQGLI